MTNEERLPLPDADSLPDDAPAADDDLRFAPPEAESQALTTVDTLPEPAEFSSADGVDIEAALAAVSTLSDMLAEQEAAEQARLEQVEADARAAEERQMRVLHPELFFPVPPPVTLRRGQMASVLPALLLIALGAGLTIMLTTAQPPDTLLIAGGVVAVLVLTLLGRWFASGRWARGSLFLGLAAGLSGLALVYLVQPGAPDMPDGWPLLLIALGAAFALTGLLAYPADRRLILPGLALALAGAAGLVVTLGLLPGVVRDAAAVGWPVVALLLLVVWLLPVLRRQRV